MKRIYLASPFFNDKELDVIQEVESILQQKDVSVFSPRDNQMSSQIGSRQWSIETFTNDIKYLKWCEVVVAVYHGNYSDSGTAFEIGYAYAMDKPVVLVHVGNDSNLMVHEGSHANITMAELVDYDFSKLVSSFYEGKMF